MFHVSEGLYFERHNTGAVRIIKRDGGQEDSPVVFDLTLDSSTWGSVIASMSFYGEAHGGFYRAMNFHTGESIPPGVELIAAAPAMAEESADEPGAEPPAEPAEESTDDGEDKTE
ncbi:MAG: hypothetical protein MOB07_23225 [Acidobacteria bacterium]|nr:hypothetical protein [Acidobacteriota bacterium]